MRKVLSTLAATFFVAALVLALPLTSNSQNREKFVISAKAGGVNAVTGHASMRAHGNTEWQQLTIKEGLFQNSHVTPAARANDTTDVWAVRHGCYTREPSQPFRSASIDQIQCGQIECDRPDSSPIMREEGRSCRHVRTIHGAGQTSVVLHAIRMQPARLTIGGNRAPAARIDPRKPGANGAGSRPLGIDGKPP